MIDDKNIVDFITGLEIKNTPEEREAVQPFLKILCEDYGYGKDMIQSHPQYRVKASPSDKKGFPIDIAVFENVKGKRCLKMVVECKNKNRKDGIDQLQHYLKFCEAKIGIWFNGTESVCIKKCEMSGNIQFEEIPAFPKADERLEDIGLYRRKDLKSAHNLKDIFKIIRGYIVANSSGVNRDEQIAKEMIHLILCKIYDERFTNSDDMLNFRASVNDDEVEIKKRIEKLFNEVKEKYNDVLSSKDEISFDGKTLKYIISKIQNICIIDTDRDTIADAFEVFIGYSLKGSQGQFFTPKNIVQLMVKIVNPQRKHIIIDPSCGSCGFLVEALKYIWGQIEQQFTNLESQWEERKEVGIKNIRGLEKDSFLTKVGKSYMAILGDGKGGIFCEDSLEEPKFWSEQTRQHIHLESFDIAFSNPPFGKDIKIDGKDKLKQYQLSGNKSENGSVSTLFFERNLQLLKDGGVLAIILPETYFHAPATKNVRQFMYQHNIQWIIDIPHNTFRPHNNAKCIILIIQKNTPQNEYINMAVAEYIGHDHNGKPIYDKNGNIKDDTLNILSEFYDSKGANNYVFKVRACDIIKRDILIPRYYWNIQEKSIIQKAKNKGIKFIKIQTLIDEGILTFFDGNGSPKAEFKGIGEKPYIRVKDIVNWQIYKDPTALIPQEEFDRLYKDNKKLQEKDILFVRRGSYRIGSVAMVSPYDLDCILTREILVLRVKEYKNKYGITPYYLLYALSHIYTFEQEKNKIFLDTTLPNIADRWKEIGVPIYEDKARQEKISTRIKNLIENQWHFLEEIASLKKTDGIYYT